MEMQCDVQYAMQCDVMRRYYVCVLRSVPRRALLRGRVRPGGPDAVSADERQPPAGHPRRVREMRSLSVCCFARAVVWLL